MKQIFVIDMEKNALSTHLELHIEQLVLHGFEPRDRARMGTVVQQELTRLFAEQGIPPSFERGGAISHLDAGTVERSSDAKPDAIAIQIARAIYGGLNQ
jgi:hypothetical protein